MKQNLTPPRDGGWALSFPVCINGTSCILSLTSIVLELCVGVRMLKNVLRKRGQHTVSTLIDPVSNVFSYCKTNVSGRIFT